MKCEAQKQGLKKAARKAARSVESRAWREKAQTISCNLQNNIQYIHLQRSVQVICFVSSWWHALFSKAVLLINGLSWLRPITCNCWAILEKVLHKPSSFADTGYWCIPNSPCSSHSFAPFTHESMLSWHGGVEALAGGGGSQCSPGS